MMGEGPTDSGPAPEPPAAASSGNGADQAEAVTVRDKRFWARRAAGEALEAEAGRKKLSYVEELEAQLKQAREQVEETRAAYRRFKDEGQAARRRQLEELDQRLTRMQAEFFHGFLPVLDNFELAMHVPATTPEARAVLEGAQLTYRQLLSHLKEQGLTPVDLTGTPFDPDQAEAVETVPADADRSDGQVVETKQKGYRFQEQLLRPARVVVAKAAD